MPAAARKFESPFPVSPSGGKPGREGSPHAAHAVRQHNPLARIDAAAPPARGVSKRCAETPLANPPCGVSGAWLDIGGTGNHRCQGDVLSATKCHPCARIKLLPIHQAVHGPTTQRPQEQATRTGDAARWGKRLPNESFGHRSCGRISGALLYVPFRRNPLGTV